MALVEDRPLVFVVDDDPDIREFAEACLDPERFQVETFESGEACLEALGRSAPSAVLLDLHMRGMGGLATLDELARRQKHLPVVILTSQDDASTAVATIRRGAWDFLAKPIDAEKLATTVQNAVQHHAMALRLATLERQAKGESVPGLVGRSPAMRRLAEEIEQVAAADISVYVHGESGTGKELVSRAIHDLSARAAGPFVAVNCAGIPESLQEAELFGYERGAFTGADRARDGRFVQASGGTLFLDEVAELSPSAQSKLLRVLQERKVQPLGSGVERPVDFRLVVATHRDLAAEVEAGRFREDLYYRIVVFELHVPPLREREGDALLLARHFLDEFGPRLVGTSPLLSPEAAVLIADYDWPGNVRELQNAIQRAIVRSGGGVIRPEDLPPSLLRGSAEAARQPAAEDRPEVRRVERRMRGRPRTPGQSNPFGDAAFVVTPKMSLQEVERRAIELTLRHHGGNIVRTARSLGIGRTTLYRKLKRYGLKPKDP